MYNNLINTINTTTININNTSTTTTQHQQPNTDLQAANYLQYFASERCCQCEKGYPNFTGAYQLTLRWFEIKRVSFFLLFLPQRKGTHRCCQQRHRLSSTFNTSSSLSVHESKCEIMMTREHSQECIIIIFLINPFQRTESEINSV